MALRLLARAQMSADVRRISPGLRVGLPAAARRQPLGRAFSSKPEDGFGGRGKAGARLFFGGLTVYGLIYGFSHFWWPSDAVIEEHRKFQETRIHKRSSIDDRIERSRQYLEDDDEKKLRKYGSLPKC